MATTRKRILSFKGGTDLAHVDSWNVGRTSVTSTSVSNRSVSIVGQQETTDEGASQWHQLSWLKSVFVDSSTSDANTKRLYRFERKRDLGTEFSTKTNRYVENAGDILARKSSVPPLRHDVEKLPRGLADYYFDGELFAQNHSVGINNVEWPVLNITDQSLLWALGATAISRVLPTNPISDAMTFAGELRNDGLPLIPLVHSLKDRIGYFKSLGDEYLNVQFGWAPFISDLTKFATAAHNGHAILRQYERDSGKGVRRRYTFPTLDTTSITVLPNGFPQPALNTLYYSYNASRDGARTVSRREITDTWFSGCFTYYLNMGDSARDRMERHAQEAKKLFGVRLTPDVLWNLAPWSWAADWFANTGDVIHNIAAFSQDGLVMRYGYIMQHKIVADTYRLSDFYWNNGTRFTPTTQTFISETKVRKKASPYGFGLTFSSFTQGQLAILAALGLSRSGR